MHILLVEDNADHASLIQRCLKRGDAAHTVDHVSDGQAALDYLEARTPPAEKPLPDLVLLDLKLPLVSGHEVLASIKSEPGTQNVPVVVLTTSSSDVDRSMAYSLHANSYLVKAAEFSVLWKMLDDFQRYWSEWNQSPNPTRGV